MSVPILVLVLAGLAISTQAGRQSLSTQGPQGFSETLYAFVVFLVAFVIIFALLNFLVALFLGPLGQALTTHLY